MKISDQNSLIKILEKEFPLKSQEKWDFSGFSFLAKKEKELKILICLDVDLATILKAIKFSVSIIISHHPFCFAPSLQEAIEIDPSKKELIKLLDQNNISTYSVHTPFDSHKNGTDYYLLQKLGLLNHIDKTYQFSVIVNYQKSFISLVDLLKKALNLNFIISNWDQSEEAIIKKVYFAPGAGDIYQFIEHNKQENCDLLITSDIKWNEQILLKNMGLNFMIVSHQIEEVFIEGMVQFLKDKVDHHVEIISDYKKEFLKTF